MFLVKMASNFGAKIIHFYRFSKFQETFLHFFLFLSNLGSIFMQGYGLQEMGSYIPETLGIPDFPD